MKNSIFQCKLTRCTQLRDFLLVRVTSVLGVLAAHRPRAFGKDFGVGPNGGGGIYYLPRFIFLSALGVVLLEADCTTHDCSVSLSPN